MTSTLLRLFFVVSVFADPPLRFKLGDVVTPHAERDTAEARRFCGAAVAGVEGRASGLRQRTGGGGRSRKAKTTSATTGDWLLNRGCHELRLPLRPAPGRARRPSCSGLGCVRLRARLLILLNNIEYLLWDVPVGVVPVPVFGVAELDAAARHRSLVGERPAAARVLDVGVLAVLEVLQQLV